MRDLAADVQRVGDAPRVAGPSSSSGTNSGTISASNIEPPQVGTIFMPRYGYAPSKTSLAEVRAPATLPCVSVHDQSHERGKVRSVPK